MKTLRFLGMAVVALLMTFVVASCGSDDDNVPSTTNLANTTWKWVSSTDSTGKTRTYDNDKHYFTFHSDGTAVMGNETGEYHWTLEGNTLTILRYENLDEKEQKENNTDKTYGPNPMDKESIRGTLTVEGNNAKYDAYWAYGRGKIEKYHYIYYLEKK